MLNALDHLCDLNVHDYVIKPRTSLIFTEEDEDNNEDEDEQQKKNDNKEENNESNTVNSDRDSNRNAADDNIHGEDPENIHLDKNIEIVFPSTRTEELLTSTNSQQGFLANFFKDYLTTLMRYEATRHRFKYAWKPLPFHIVVNGLAGSGNSYVISIIKQMLSDFCISESAIRNRPRRRKGLLKMAHTGKAALNILGWTIHAALGMRPDNTSTPNNAPSFKIHSLRNRLDDLIFIIIDEISLVSHSLFQKMNKRLNEIFEVADKSNVYFGNIPYLLFGDLAQCEPVAAKQIFWQAPVSVSGEYNEEDEKVIKSRSIRKEDNPEHYKERLAELQSTDFANARYVEWCLPNLSEVDKVSSTPSKKRNKLMSSCDVKALKCEHSTLLTTMSLRKPENIIICEEHEKNYCGRHVLRALAQRLDLFSDEYLMEIAENIAATEQICRNGKSIRITDDYYEGHGDYDIQVLQLALQHTLNVHLVQIHELETNTCPIQNLILSNSQNIQALLIREDYHYYYCLRRFQLTKNYFFKIDSKDSMHHQPIHRQNILNFLRTLLESHCSIYVIMQHDPDNVNEQLSTDNIEAKLWALPDAPADLEILPGFYETE
ncbi:unnamed protein product [Rotaria sordida]|uniref:ATP-dependent DNA helicase n=1 Tax=Rotaria sordida TaxID=392033 RepID=A0A815IIC9_9BILA|nr:unnamed protein product [Rotaria sordida]CAF1370181.1 unnamed protein product [Rotaria sordida]CAF3929726.1 unnamed protein product [Rotaria sordida]CAF3958500.1 unnamed protein product [Rotaria sordida]